MQGIIASIVVDIGGSIALYLWAHWTLAVLCVGVGAGFVCVLVLIRSFRLRRIHSDQSLHSFFHESRDYVAKISIAANPNEYRHSLDNFHGSVAQGIADFYRERIGDRSACCAIRLAEVANGHEQYATVARSDRMHTTRAQNTQPIPADTGIAHALLQYEQQGVIIIDDIHNMEGDPRWLCTRNDKLGDVRSLMVAPINGWNGGEKGMLGILFISSATPRKLEAGHTLPMKAFADFLGLVYPSILKSQGGTNG